MIQILDTAHSSFEEEKRGMLEKIDLQEQVIQELREHHDALNDYNTQNETKI